MQAVCWYGPKDVRVERVPDPQLLNPRDAIIRARRTAICGSDLHLDHGYIPTMEAGDILGHEFMGEVVEVGPEGRRVRRGDRVVVPFAIACGACFFCSHDLTSLRDNTNPNARTAEILYGYAGSGLFGYSHLCGGYAGGQAEYVRVPFADVGAFPVPETLTDEQALFLTDILPTGWMARRELRDPARRHRRRVGRRPGGPGRRRQRLRLGADRVIAIDRISERLDMAAHGKAETLNYEHVDVVEALRDMTGGRGPDACIDAVGMEAHGVTPTWLYDRAKQALMLETDRPDALREAILACRKGGTVSMPGVYGGFIDKAPLGAAFAKALTLRMGQTHVHRYVRPLLDRIQRGEIDPTFVITHRLALGDAPGAYAMFGNKQDECIKVVLSPDATPAATRR